MSRHLCNFSENGAEPDVDEGAEDFYAIMGVVRSHFPQINAARDSADCEAA